MFKTKKKNKLFSKIFYLFIGICAYYFTYNYLNITNNLVDNNEEFLIDLGLDRFNVFSSKKLSIKSILYEGLNYTVESNIEKKVSNNSINDITVYIYNTHQSEEYDTKLFNAYNISYTVETASFLLKDSLKKYNISSLVENESIASYLNENNLSYKDSYKASKYYIEKVLNSYPNIKYLIDIHRDSLTKDKTTIIYKNKAYAKVLFIIGGDNPNYLKNYSLALKINSKIDNDLRGDIIIKKGKGVNGVYNQDISENAILIEIGGKENNIEEVYNTTNVLAKAIYESEDNND